MTTWDQLPFIGNVKDQPDVFGNKVIAIASDINFLPEWLMCIFENESGVNPDAVNASSGATGLLQFMPATASDLGTDTNSLAAMDGVDQLDYVEKYFTKYGYYKQVNDFGDAYLAVFFPEALFQDDNWQFPDWAVKANPSFDTNHDGILTKQEFKDGVTAKYAAYLPAPESAEVTDLATKKKFKRGFGYCFISQSLSLLRIAFGIITEEKNSNNLILIK